ncbi:MAG: D-2-hydroxyacid dehydrogenase [Anaerobacillus sp.]|uniref:D-2-hydroxyacid dehydrogenase n=1 Tax=Anaerobacillus sp. TaxID=1872506 RepID=UPI00391B8D51
MKIVASTKLKSELKEKLIANYPELKFYFFKNMAEAIDDLLDADVFITYGEDLTEEIIMKVKKLKWIMVFSAGVEKLPFRAIKQKGILVTNARGIHKIPMAEYTMAMILQVARQAKQLISNEQKHVWDRSVPMTELSGKTLGVLGAGAIGTQIAKYAQVFNMKTIGLNRSGRSVEAFDEMVTVNELGYLLEKSDFVVSVLPSTPKTDRMINREVLQQMKASAVFINIGRGQNVVEVDLISALEEGEIAHAVLDVFEKEPLPAGHPFWEMENVTVTPHLSGISNQYLPRAIEIFENNLKEFLSGKKEFINVIDLDHGY